MQRYAIVLIILLIPLLAFATVIPNLFGSHFGSTQILNNHERSWRLNYNLEEMYQDNLWANSAKNVYYYNSVHPTAIDSIVTYSYEEQTMTWNIQSATIFTYDATYEYVIEGDVYMINLNPPIRMLFMREYIDYNENNYLKDVTIQFLDSFTRTLADVSRLHLTYANNNVSSSITWYAEDLHAPQHLEKTTFAFDFRGRIIQEFMMTSADSSNWVNSEQTDRTYHQNDITTSAIFLNNVAHMWGLDAMTGGSMMFGMVSTEIIQTWLGDAWINSSSATYTYNASNKLIQVLNQEWDGTSAWVNLENNIYTYDANNNMDQYVNQEWTDPNWVNKSRMTYFWNNSTANDDPIVVAPGNLSMVASPNPFQSNLDMKVNAKSNQPVQIEVFNIKGQSVYQTKTMPNTEISINGKEFSSGIYFVKAKQGNQTITHKILKLK